MLFKYHTIHRYWRKSLYLWHKPLKELLSHFVRLSVLHSKYSRLWPNVVLRLLKKAWLPLPTSSYFGRKFDKSETLEAGSYGSKERLLPLPKRGLKPLRGLLFLFTRQMGSRPAKLENRPYSPKLAEIQEPWILRWKVCIFLRNDVNAKSLENRIKMHSPISRKYYIVTNGPFTPYFYFSTCAWIERNGTSSHWFFP